MAEWNINIDHTTAAFSIRHMEILNIRGMFNNVKGAVTFDPAAPADLGLQLTIDVKSLDTGTVARDAHLLSPAFFDADRFPVITFNSTGARLVGTDGLLSGELTIHGVTRAVTLNVGLSGPVVAPPELGRGTVLGLFARTTIDRRDFGMDLDMPMAEGGAIVGWQVDVVLECEADLAA